MKQWFVWIIIFVVAGGVWYYAKHPLTTVVRIGEAVFYTEIAATSAEKEKGLGYRDSLDQNRAMLFPYDHKEQYSFWMKGMRFPIDIIWISDNLVVDISKNVPVSVDGQLPSYSSRVPVNKVLEVNAGLSDKYGLAPGDLVHIDN